MIPGTWPGEAVDVAGIERSELPGRPFYRRTSELKQVASLTERLRSGQ